VERSEAEALDRDDPLGPVREQFVVGDPDVCYLDGNSLGRLPRRTVERLARLVTEEWGTGLVRSWERWIDLPAAVGDAIAPLIGAPAGSVLVADSTTVNLHALVDAAAAARPDRPVLVVADGEFPTDRYVVAGVAAARGLEVRLAATDPIEGPTLAAIEAAVAPDDVALVVVSAVDFRSGARLDLAGVVETCRRSGAWACLDLSHAVGAVPVDLGALGVELAVGCTYKHLCGGPGAPAFLYVRPDLQAQLRRPQWGWFGHRDPFAMVADHEPAPGIAGFLAGTPSVLGLVAAGEGVALVSEAGMARIDVKRRALVEVALRLIEERLVPLGFALASPADPARLGAHVSVAHPEAAAIGAAARAAGVVPDVRPPDRIRLGLSPLTTSFVELHDGIERLAEVARSEPSARFEPPRVP
jgi:kynureninase